MKPVTAIKRFMEEHRGCYRNSHGIEFDRMDDSLMVSYTDYHNPEHKYLDFFLSYEKGIQEFIMDFAINRPQDLDNVTREQLWNVFWSGKGKIYCGLEFSLIYFILYFRAEDQKLFAIKENKESPIPNRKPNG